jgi:hypothetical protein
MCMCVCVMIKKRLPQHRPPHASASPAPTRLGRPTCSCAHGHGHGRGRRAELGEPTRRASSSTNDSRHYNSRDAGGEELCRVPERGGASERTTDELKVLPAYHLLHGVHERQSTLQQSQVSGCKNTSAGRRCGVQPLREREAEGSLGMATLQRHTHSTTITTSARLAHRSKIRSQK